MEEPRTRAVPLSVDASLMSKGAPLARTGWPAGPDPPPPVYNLYTKINAFLNTRNNRIVQNDLCASFTSFLHGTFCFSLPLYLYKICRSARSTRVDRFAERSLRKTSFSLSPLFFLSLFFFGTIFEMHSQLSSANLFALALAELQDHAGSPGETRARLASLPSVVKASSSECY